MVLPDRFLDHDSPARQVAAARARRARAIVAGGARGSRLSDQDRGRRRHRLMARRLRADQALVERGLAESRTRAQALILAGKVFSRRAAG